MNKSEAIKKFPMYEFLLEGAPAEINFSVENFSKGTVIIQKGEEIEKVMIVVSGELLVYNEYVDGEVIYVQSEDVSFIGDIELISNQNTYVCSVSAKNNCKLLCMTKDDYINWFDNDTGLMREMVVRLAMRNCKQSSRVGSLKYLSTEERVIKFLLDRFERFSFTHEDKRKIKITRSVIAFQVGASERMVNRIISSLKKSGLIDTGYGVLSTNTENKKNLEKLIKIY
jgi:CRP-like cAMP-binding protein